MRRHSPNDGTDRGQIVLLAAVAIAVALVPMLLAYMQLAYHPAVAGPQPDYASDVERTLERSLANVSEGIPTNYAWSDRDAAVTELREGLAPTLDSLNRSALARGTAIQVSFNTSRAAARANATCPGGPGREFGPCEADRGVVVQERAGGTHVLAAAIDVRVIGQESETVVYATIERR